jgi:hypothetical protein
MSAFSFLKGATIVEDNKKPAATGGNQRRERNPAATLLALRLFASGAIYPSQAATDKFCLEYRRAVISKEADSDRNSYEYPDGAGQGFDIIDSRVWIGYKAPGDMLFIAPVDKLKSKVDLFKVVKYNEDGTPASSVMDQGAETFGKEVLLPAVKELYGIELGEDKPFVDLVICEELEGVNIPEKFRPKNGFHLFPKQVTRGKDKGTNTYERRENTVIYGLVPAGLLAQSEAEAAAGNTGGGWAPTPMKRNKALPDTAEEAAEAAGGGSDQAALQGAQEHSGGSLSQL